MSTFYNFRWCFGGTITSQHGRIFGGGRRIHIVSRLSLQEGEGRQQLEERAAVTGGRAPNASVVKLSLQEKYTLPVPQRNKSTNKVHSFARNVAKGQQNTGKW